MGWEFAVGGSFHQQGSLGILSADGEISWLTTVCITDLTKLPLKIPIIPMTNYKHTRKTMSCLDETTRIQLKNKNHRKKDTQHCRSSPLRQTPNNKPNLRIYTTTFTMHIFIIIIINVYPTPFPPVVILSCTTHRPTPQSWILHPH